jgi:hypothetical protein
MAAGSFTPVAQRTERPGPNGEAAGSSPAGGACQLELRNAAGETVAWAVVDGADARWVLRSNWFKVQPNGRQVYVARRGKSGEPGIVYLHREVLGLVAGDGMVADHIDGNTLDNRRCNLRAVTHAENLRNRRAITGSPEAIASFLRLLPGRGA